MAPSRLEEKLKKLGLSADDTCSSSCRSASTSKTKYLFRIYFPSPPYDNLQFNALKSGSGFNFTGQLLGVGGKQLQRIKQESSARVEVVNRQGNLNGAHPDPLDPDLHALISADSMGKLQRAAGMVWELLQPINARFEKIDVVPGGSVRLTVEKPKGTARAAQQAGSTLQESIVSRPSSVSPSLTPVTPAATAAHCAVFSNHSGSTQTTPNSCSSRGSGSPAGADDHSKASSSSNSSSASKLRALFGNLEGFTLPPAAVPTTSSAAVPTANADAVATDDAGMAIGASAAEQHGMHDGQPHEQSAQQQQQQQEQTAVDAGPAPVPASSSASTLQPAAPQQDHGASPDMTLAVDGAQSSSLGGLLMAAAPLPAAVASGVDTAAPQQQQQQQQQGNVRKSCEEPPPSEGSCSSCFQYGLGLCGSSSSWASDSTCCLNKENPALQALLVDHQRQQQQQQLEQQAQLLQLQRHQQQVELGASYNRQAHLMAPIAMGGFDTGAAMGPEALMMQASMHPYRNEMCVPPPPAAAAPGGFPSSLLDPFGPANTSLKQQQWQLQEQHRMLAMAAAAAADSFGMLPPHGNTRYPDAGAAAGGGAVAGSLPGGSSSCTRWGGSAGPMFGASHAAFSESAPSGAGGSPYQSREAAAWLQHQQEQALHSQQADVMAHARGGACSSGWPAHQGSLVAGSPYGSMSQSIW